jgi:hypothetical protein
MTQEEADYIKVVRQHIYLNSKFRYATPANEFPEDLIKSMKLYFWELYKANVLKRNSKVETGEQEIELLKHTFEWTICSPDFKGNLSKGLMLISNQGFGKDIILNTIVQFYEYFMYNIKEYTYHEFCDNWFNNSPEMFKMPIKINDISEYGRMKREKESVPFLEFLDYREQNFLMRGVIVSSNYKPEVLQEILEDGKVVKRLHERIKECFNIVLINNKDSKRIENLIKI